ncbi:translation initiation factor IF-5A [Candidatus Pacearchaeota archaeon CG10_big_fil_rev_8_21_14_0_10_30_48]|nr:MAG: translation initiation factor IF-5A [Candidatus Pacearchaeota archaeon CG10_big_fil_rev_8_21_14_0_10_30_48]
MAYKIIEGTAVRSGSTIIIDGEPCNVKSINVSKTGKHGHAKVRIEAIGIIDGKKKVIARPGHERFEVPLIEKKKAQVLSMSPEAVNVMDIESYETFDLPIPTEEVPELYEGDQVEYWEVEDKKIIKRKI